MNTTKQWLGFGARFTRGVTLFTALLLFASAKAFGDSPAIKPGSKVQLTVGSVEASAWLGQPLWKATSINVKPHPLELPDGQKVNWTMEKVDCNHEKSLNVEGDWSDKKNLPENRTYGLDPA